MGLNQFAIKTKDEMEGGKLMMPQGRRNIQIWESKANDVPVPAEFDWVTKGGVTEVGTEGKCKASWAFASTGAIEGAYFTKTGKLNSFSEQQLIDCSYFFGNFGCDGGFMDQTFEYANVQPMMTEGDYPYTGIDGNCNW